MFHYIKNTQPCHIQYQSISHCCRLENVCLWKVLGVPYSTKNWMQKKFAGFNCCQWARNEICVQWNLCLLINILFLECDSVNPHFMYVIKIAPPLYTLSCRVKSKAFSQFFDRNPDSLLRIIQVKELHYRCSVFVRISISHVLHLVRSLNLSISSLRSSCCVCKEWHSLLSISSWGSAMNSWTRSAPLCWAEWMKTPGTHTPIIVFVAFCSCWLPFLPPCFCLGCRKSSPLPICTSTNSSGFWPSAPDATVVQTAHPSEPGLLSSPSGSGMFQEGLMVAAAMQEHLYRETSWSLILPLLCESCAYFCYIKSDQTVKH